MKKKNKLTQIVAQMLFLLVIAVAGGCSVTQQALKTGDPDFIFNEALRLYEDGEWSKAATLFEAVEVYAAGTAREDSLLFFKARCAFKDGDFYGATEQLDEFRRTYGRSVFLEDAEGMYTLSFYYLSPAPNRDQSMSQVAIVAIDEFLSRYPQSEQRENFEGIKEELLERLHKKSFDNAYSYYKIGRYKSAIISFKNAMKEYPGSGFRESISYYTVASSYELARNSVESKKEDRYLAMIDSYYTFIAEFPESTFRKDVDQMLKKGRDYIDKKRVNDGYVEEKERKGLWERIFGSRDAEREARMSQSEAEKAKELEGVSDAASNLDRPDRIRRKQKLQGVQ